MPDFHIIFLSSVSDLADHGLANWTLPQVKSLWSYPELTLHDTPQKTPFPSGCLEEGDSLSNCRVPPALPLAWKKLGLAARLDLL
jgi:hypothetical protein